MKKIRISPVLFSIYSAKPMKVRLGFLIAGKKVLMSNLSEEKLASLLSKKLAMPVKGFGSSDKKSKAHLFYGLLTAIKIPL